ncbi:hypothetical protein AMECASPLE_017288, partial [Ameca splendens]
FCPLTTALCLFTGFANLRILSCVTLTCCHQTITLRSRKSVFLFSYSEKRFQSLPLEVSQSFQ